MELGWIYEFATEESQRYKEGNVILEKSVIKELRGFDEDRPSFHLNVDLSQVSAEDLEDYVFKNKKSKPTNNSSSSVRWSSDQRESPTVELCALPDSDEEPRATTNSQRTTPLSGQLLPPSSFTGSNRSTPLSHASHSFPHSQNSHSCSSGRSSATKSMDLFAPIRSNTQGMFLSEMEPNLTPVSVTRQIALNVQTIEGLKNCLHQYQNTNDNGQHNARIMEINQVINQLLETNEKMKSNEMNAQITPPMSNNRERKFPSSVETVTINLNNRRTTNNPDHNNGLDDFDDESEGSSEGQSPDNRSQDDDSGSMSYSNISSRRTSNNNERMGLRTSNLGRYNYSLNPLGTGTQQSTTNRRNLIETTDLRQQGRLAGRLGTSPQPNINLHNTSLPSTSNITTSAIRTSSLPLEARYRSYLRSSNRAQQTATNQATTQHIGTNLTLSNLIDRQVSQQILGNAVARP